MKRYTNKSIASYLKPFIDIENLQDNEICIDRQGNLHTLPLNDVRKFNGSYANTKNDTYFREKISFIANYISVLIYEGQTFGGEYTCFSCDICEDYKPTNEQLETLFDLIKQTKKINKKCFFDISWRWLAGGGHILCWQKSPHTTIEKITKAITNKKEWAENGLVKYCDFIAEIKGEN